MLVLSSRTRWITRSFHHSFSTLAAIQETKARGLLFRLTSDDPFLNLSIEHHIFQHVPLNTKVLLFYINRPCIVIGRNQNPWVEINLSLLNSKISNTEVKVRKLDKVDFVRRRSGGGTVFHDAGNVNWGVICDSNDFTRDKHAEMVVSGIRAAGISNVRVNERHDIVLENADSTPLKVSGSAYKLARGRALHHGTALCQSQNLDVIPQFLRSPAKSYITARGVDSVRSPITNLGIDAQKFCTGVEAAFREMYHVPADAQPLIELGIECLDIPDIRRGYEELKSSQWRFLQTPGFEVSIQSPTFGQFEMSVKHGAVVSSLWTLPDGEVMQLDLTHLELHQVDEWLPALKLSTSPNNANGATQHRALAEELERLLPPMIASSI